MTLPALLPALLAAALVSAAPPQGPAPLAGEAPAVPASTYEVETVAEGLSKPWDIAFLPEGSGSGDVLVTEKTGALRVVRGGALLDAPVQGTPAVFAEGQAGLFEALPHPGFARNGLLYLSYAAGPADANTLVLGRGRYVATEEGARLDDFEVLLEAKAVRDGDAHYGGRMAWMADGSLLLTSGEAYRERHAAQSLGSHFGKILRLTEDGAPAPGNPFAGVEGALPEIWTTGHRNPQGIVRVGSAVYAHEHGPKGGDELNLIERGANYGWPGASYGLDYSGAMITPYATWDGTVQPLVQWTPSIAPSALAYYDGEAFPRWRGKLLASALAHRHVRLIDLSDPTQQRVLFGELGARVRDVAPAPDGAVWLALEGEDGADGRVVRVTPAAGGAAD